MEMHWHDVFSVSVLLTALAGSVLGVLWGAIPGLSVNMAMALLVGITYTMPPELAIPFMLSVWIAAEFGGAIPAIMINIPGTPAAVPTKAAGYPLARRGNGEQAVGAALYASAVGGWPVRYFSLSPLPC